MYKLRECFLANAVAHAGVNAARNESSSPLQPNPLEKLFAKMKVGPFWCYFYKVIASRKFRTTASVLGNVFASKVCRG